MALLYVSEWGCSGYALAARAYLLALQSWRHPLTWCPVGWSKGPARPYAGPTGDPLLEPLRAQHPGYRRALLHLVPTLHADWMLQTDEAVAYTTWETDRLPPAWVDRLNRLQRVLVPCTWNREVFENSGVRVPVQVVPHMVPDDLEDLPLGPDAQQPFTFYTIAPWTRRKALDLLLEAYWQAFPTGERVRLVVKTGRHDRTRHSEVFALRHLLNLGNGTARTVARLRRRHRRPAPVQLLAGDRARRDILRLHHTSHCFVSMSRGEGWGLGTFEAAALGKPVICPAYGGQMDYLEPALCHLVDYRLVPCSVGCWERHYGGEGQRWAEPSVEHAAQLMRQVFVDYQEAQARAAALRSLIRQRFCRQAVLPGLLAAC